MRRHERSIERYTGQLFIWRSIADGLVYAYISTFNAKHAFFDTTSPAPKREAGFIGGKAGLAKELGMLFSAIEHRVPAVLSDITNIIRYGDVCLLGGDDPCPIEVKSGPVLNQRGHRQAAKLAQLEDFLKNDRAVGFRGMPEMQRVEFGVPHHDCIADLNACIQSARYDGWNFFCPERGLVYAAIFEDAPIDTLFKNLGMKRPVIFMPNAEKMDRSWAPYLPFTISIRAPLDLYDFVVGKLSLVVVVDAAVICDRLATPGWKISLVEDRNHSILLEHGSTAAKITISTQFFGRLGLEFISLDWFVEHHKKLVASMWTDMMAGKGPMIDPAEFEDWDKAIAALPRAYEASGD
jgi:hypothetical protein